MGRAQQRPCRPHRWPLGGVDVSGLVERRDNLQMMGAAPYYFVMLLALLPVLTNDRRRPSFGWWGYFAILLVFVGLRYHVGSDWSGYLMIFEDTKEISFQDILEKTEPLFYFIFWLSAKLDLGIYGANVVTTLIFLWGLFHYCEKQPSRWLAVASAVPFLVIVIGMSANRQAAAIGVTLYLLSSWRTNSIRKNLLLISVATLIHNSAIVFAALFIFDGRLSSSKKYVISVALIGISVYIFGGSATTARYVGSYIEGREIFKASGALQQILLNAVPGIFVVVLRRRLKRVVPDFGFVYTMALLSIALVPAAFVISVAASRLSFYIFPVSISFLAAIPEIFLERDVKLAIRYFVMVYALATLFIWLNYATHAYNHIPYGNILLG